MSIKDIKKRPVNLDLTTIKLPVNAIVSIMHRISGVILFVGFGFMLYVLELSLSTDAGFAVIEEKMSSFFCRLVIWGILSALIYHLVAGIKHLLMDMTIGDTKVCGKYASIFTLCVSVILIALLGRWLW